MLYSPRPYRKLCRWQGLFASGALFLDEHCLIAVRSNGYEERVKRLFYKDIQAIVISKSRQFGISRPVLLAVLAFLLGYVLMSAYSPPLARILWVPAAGLAAVWLYVALQSSCRCRIYTAVSQEELLAVRRSWAARKLLAELTPRIEAAQGTLPGGWQESIAGDRPILLSSDIAPPDPQAAAREPAQSNLGRFTPSVVLVSSLLLDVMLTSWDLGRTVALPNWIGSVLALIEGAAAVWAMIQNRGVNAWLTRFGAVVLVFLGAAFYGQYVISGFATAQARRPLRADELRAAPIHHAYLEAYIAGCLILGIAGALLTLTGPSPAERRAMAD